MATFEKNLLLLVMDSSTSMNGAASNDNESIGYTRNDFARQGAMLCVNACPETMYMSCISFSSTAKIVSEIKQMSNTNKISMCEDIKKITPYGGTEILSAMNLSNQLINEACEIYGIKNIKIIMFTDGEDNKLSESNVTAFFDKFKQNGEFKFKMDTVGFGESANTQLLVKMSNLCCGTYALCFDSSMVGTIFGRAVARSYLGTEVFGIQESTEIQNAEYYISRDVYHEYRTELSNILLNTTYMTLKDRVDQIDICNTKIEAWIRINSSGLEKTTPDWFNLIYILYVDLNNEIRMAVSDEKVWLRWGKAYWQTIGIALQKQYAPNFKDECLQIFGSDQAKAEYNRISALYDDMDMIPPSNVRATLSRTTAIPQRSCTFNCRSGPCFHPNSVVKLSTGNIISLQNLESVIENGGRVQVISYVYGLVTIEAILKTKMYNHTKFCKIGNTVLTPTHPIFVGGRWFHPKTLTEIYEEDVSFVYNFVLGINPNTGKRYTSLSINDNECLGLGHGIENDPIATDSFWGSEEIVNTLKRLYVTDYSNGVIHFNHKFIRNEITGWIDKVDLGEDVV